MNRKNSIALIGIAAIALLAIVLLLKGRNTEDDELTADVLRVKDYGDDVYTVTCDDWASPDAEKTGESVMQTWVIKGKDKVMAIDNGAYEVEGYRKFLEDTFGLPVMMVNSHGHIDHIACNEQFEEVYLNEGDWPLLLQQSFLESDDENPDMSQLSYKVISMDDGEVFDLGDRKVTVLLIPGHTPGSMCFFDEKTNALFSGDTVARRLIYGSVKWEPISDFFASLDKIAAYPITKVYSAHDVFELPADMPERIEGYFKEFVPTTDTLWDNPLDGSENIRILTTEDEKSLDFFDMTYPSQYHDQAVKEVEELKESGDSADRS